jgi:starch-binding outer membrane protein, SusD/RagB family
VQSPLALARLVVASFLLGTVSSCREQTTGPDTGGLAVVITSQVSLSMIESWRVSINGPSGSSSRTGSPGTTIEFTGLRPGGYPVFLEGFEGPDVELRGQQNVTVVAGQNTDATVPVSPVVATVTVTPGGSLPPAATLQLTATARDASGNVVSASTIGWASSNTSILTVANGLVTGVSIGQATVTAAILGQSGQVTITVRAWNASEAATLRAEVLNRLSIATSGGESTHLLGGLLADEFRIGDTDPARIEIDKRSISANNAVVSNAYRELHRARRAAQLGIAAFTNLEQTAPSVATKIALSEMWYAKGHVENLLGEHFCSGVAFTNLDTLTARSSHGTPEPTAAVFTRAKESLDNAESYAASVTPADTAARHRRSMALVARARAFLNLGQFAEALASSTASGFPAPAILFQHSVAAPNAVVRLNGQERRYIVADVEGALGLNFVSASDPRVRTFFPFGVAADGATPFILQLRWDQPQQHVELASVKERDLITAEVLLRGGDVTTSFSFLNGLRNTVPGLMPLTDPGTAQARVDLLFRERAFWLWGTGHRMGDLRRLVRQYGRPQNSVFPFGSHHKGGTYGVDVTLPIVQTDDNNPNFAGCLDRNP